jgi:hypothetical protein
MFSLLKRKLIINASEKMMRQKLQNADVRATIAKSKVDMCRVIEGSRWARHLGMTSAFRVDCDWRRLPISEYEDVSPFIKAAADGQMSAMFASKHRLQALALTSGTTGSRKLIPWTEAGCRRLAAAWREWGLMLYRQHLDLALKPIFQMTSFTTNQTVQAVVPVGDLSGILTSIQPAFLRWIYQAPASLQMIGAQEHKYYAFLRVMLCRDDIRIISTATPSTLVSLAYWSEYWKEDLLRDLSETSLTTKLDFTDEHRSMISKLIRPVSQDRLKFLKSVSLRDRFIPKNYWPQLRVLSCWIGGSMRRFTNDLYDSYGDVHLRDLGYVSSEGSFSLVKDDLDSRGILRLNDYVFEFLSEGHQSSDDLLQVDELQVGEEYRVVISNFNGLIRYPMHDVVRYEGCSPWGPMLSFLRKESHISDLTGEKLSVNHIDQALAKLKTKFALSSCRFFVAANQSVVPKYDLYIECNGRIDASERGLVSAYFDQVLAQSNFIYEEHREVQKLGQPGVYCLAIGTAEKFRKRFLERSRGSLEQYKESCLITDPSDIQWFGEFVA